MREVTVEERVNILTVLGTLLASGSDDLNITVWDWQQGKPYFSFNSGHRANVFQVHTTLHHTAPHHTTPHCTILLHTILDDTQHCIMQQFTTTLHCPNLHCTTPH